MQKYILLLCSLSTIVVLTLGLSSCKDDEPFVKPNLSVATDALSIGEAAGTVQVEVTLDKGAPEDITIEYDLGGTAISPADYTVSGKEGEIKIAKGETSGKVTIQIVSDALYEGNETIELSLEDVSSDDVLITNDDEVLITITDDDPQLKVSFPVTTLTVMESDNEDLLEINVELDNPATQEVTVAYTITHGAGFAIDDVFATAEEIPAQYIDYEIQGGQLSVTIPQGSKTGKIQLQLFSDFLFENDEKIELTLSTVSNGIQIGTNNKMTVTVEQEDGRVIALVWDDAYTDVDMDLFMWLGEDVAGLELQAVSNNPDVDPTYEFLFLPAVIQDAAVGLGYNYYAGTANPMQFEVQFIDFANGVAEAQANYDIYPGSYTLANINKYDETDIEPIKAQTFTLVDGVITGITDPIVAPASGSRLLTKKLPKGFERIKSGTNKVKL